MLLSFAQLLHNNIIRNDNTMQTFSAVLITSTKTMFFSLYLKTRKSSGLKKVNIHSAANFC